MISVQEGGSIEVLEKISVGMSKIQGFYGLMVFKRLVQKRNVDVTVTSSCPKRFLSVPSFTVTNV